VVTPTNMRLPFSFPPFLSFMLMRPFFAVFFFLSGRRSVSGGPRPLFHESTFFESHFSPGFNQHPPGNSFFSFPFSGPPPADAPKTFPYSAIVICPSVSTRTVFFGRRVWCRVPCESLFFFPSSPRLLVCAKTKQRFPPESSSPPLYVFSSAPVFFSFSFYSHRKPFRYCPPEGVFSSGLSPFRVRETYFP